MTWKVWWDKVLVAQFVHEKDARLLMRYDSNRKLNLQLTYAEEDMERNVCTTPLNNIETYWLLRMKTGMEV